MYNRNNKDEDDVVKDVDWVLENTKDDIFMLYGAFFS